MTGLRSSTILISTFLTTIVFAQPGIEDEDAAAARDPDVVAAEELVRELRSSRDVSEEPSVSLEEMLANGSRAVNQMVEQEGCELGEPIKTEIESLESQLAEARRVGGSDFELQSLQSRLVNTRVRAIRSCCEQESIVCFE